MHEHGTYALQLLKYTFNRSSIVKKGIYKTSTQNVELKKKNPINIIFRMWLRYVWGSGN